jgi:hypothetical protein
VGWEVVLVEEVEQWYLALDEDTAAQVTSAIELLEEQGPTLPRPFADRVHGSKYHSMKELRPGSARTTEIRILFIFDPNRQAVLLVAGDKSRAWKTWYRQAVPLAERRYEQYLKEQ